MYYGNIKLIDIADGDGVRVSLFVSGCRNHCKGFFTEQTWDFKYGKPFTPIEEFEIIEQCKKYHNQFYDKQYYIWNRSDNTIRNISRITGQPSHQIARVILCNTHPV